MSRPVPPQAAQYEGLSSRRMVHDQIVWQVPALGLTAQSFLFTIILGQGAANASVFWSSLLALLTSFASAQLLAKHRYLERGDRLALEAFELANSQTHAPIHTLITCHLGPPAWRWFANLSSFRIWFLTQLCFGFVAFGFLIHSGLKLWSAYRG